jgi:dienelactone hydrolase
MKKFLLLILVVVLTSCSTTPLVKENIKIVDDSLEGLRAKTYGEGELSIKLVWEKKPKFTRYFISYPSEGLTINGFVNVPVGKGPFPVILALHGYIPPEKYKTLDYTTRYADALAINGYIVLHPNLRDFPPSDPSPNKEERLTGYTTDSLNLLAFARALAGKEGVFKDADFSRLGIWGHSMGGGTSLRVLSVLTDIKAAVIYAGVSQLEPKDPMRYSFYDLSNSTAAFSLHHGDQDSIVPSTLTEALDLKLRNMGKQVEYFTYPGQPHTLFGQNDALFIQRMIAFYDKLLKIKEIN